MPVEMQPITSDRWNDLESLFSANGACGGCWCMFWRLERAEYKKLRGNGTKAVLKSMAEQGEAPGLVAYLDGKPAAWCSIGPRENYRALENSRILKRVDDAPVWSIVCFFVARPFRKKGLMYEVLRGAVDYAAQNGAKIIEGYPIDMQNPKLAGQKLNGPSGFMGIAAAFRQVGFVEVGRASETQLIMRYTVQN